MFAFPCGIESGAARTRQAFDLGGIIEKDGTICDGFDHRPMVVIALQTQDNGTPGRAIQKVLHRLPKGGQVWVKHTAPGNLDIRDALSAHHFIKDQQHLGVDNAAEQQFLQQPAPREEMDQVIEQLLRFIIAGAVDDALGIDDAVESAQGVESALLKREQAWV